MNSSVANIANGVATPVTPRLSVVIPVCNEAGNVERLALDICDALGQHGAFEIIFVDDASTDRTVGNIRAVRRERVPQIRLLRHSVHCGPGVALRTGVCAARSEWIVTLDADGQYDPADIPVLLEMLEQGAHDLRLVMGNRRRGEDTWMLRVSARLMNSLRRLRGDRTPDGSCGIKLFHRATFLTLPAVNHMHRFLPVLFQGAGAGVTSVGVCHRPQIDGRSKHDIVDRLWLDIVDVLGAHRLLRRAPDQTDAREE